MPSIESKLSYDVAVICKPRSRDQDIYGYHPNFLNRKGWFFGGVYDGHGEFDINCKNVVKSLVSEFERSLPTQQNTQLSLEDATSAFEKAYEVVTNKIREIKNPYLASAAGAMATNIFIDGSNLYIAHAGDSRVTVCVDDRLVHSTQDHPESGPLARGLGDRLIFKPDVAKLNLIELMQEGNVTILLYTDGIVKGLFGGLSPEYLATIADQYSDAKGLAEKIIYDSGEAGAHSIDDRTILVVKPYIEGVEKVRKERKPQAQQPIISTESPKKSRFLDWLKLLGK